jgi:hypothetical protein
VVGIGERACGGHGLTLAQAVASQDDILLLAAVVLVADQHHHVVAPLQLAL